MPELIMCKRGARRGAELGLFVTQEVSEEDFRALPLTQDLLVTARTARNPAQLAKVWVLAQKLSDACDWLPDKDTAMEWMKIKARHVKIIQDPETGEIAIVPKSIAFASLPQSVFSRVFDRMVWVVCNDIVSGMDESRLKKEIESMISG